MSVTVKLAELVDALNIQNYEITHYLDTSTGEIIMLTNEELSAVENGAEIDQFPGWQQETIKTAYAIAADSAGRYLELPTQFEINEHAIMENFCLSIADAEISDEMYYAIKGKGPFGGLKARFISTG